MQNSTYKSNLDPELHGSVDYDFFGEDDNEIGNKENLSSIEEVDASSRVSGDNSLKSGSIGELGGGKRDDKVVNKSSPSSVPPVYDSKSSSAESSPVSSPRQSLSMKSESTVRSGGFPPLSRGDSARPPSPTPPSSHASPSPHRVASRPRSESPRSPESSSSHRISRRNSSSSSSSSYSSKSSKLASSHSQRLPESDRLKSRSISPIQRSNRSLSPTSGQSESSETSEKSRKHSSGEESRSPSPSRRSSSSFSSSTSSITAEKKERRSSISSESDVTDVSPLSSHQHSPLGSPSPVRKESAPVNADIDDDRTNVELIMKAILELDKERHQRSKTPNHTAKQATGRIPENMSMYRPYHSTINRIREQRRIEEENRNILKRLTMIRPTPNMRRDSQLREYQRQSTYGAVQLSKARAASSDAKYRASRNTKPSSEVLRNPSANKSRRTASAKVTHDRCTSASSVSLRSSSRPEWPSGW